MRRPTIKDIAARANVSCWTVSQVLLGRKEASISTNTQNRVLSIANEIGYRPNYMARALVNARTQLVALWMASDEHSNNVNYSMIQHRMQCLTRQSGYQCIAEWVAYEDVHRKDCSQLMNWPIDGIIAYDVDGPVSAYIEIDPGKRVPIVNFGAFGVESADYVRLDLYSGALTAVRHLVDVGCKRIAYICRLPHEQRYQGYCQVMSETGRPVEQIVCPVDNRACGRESLLAYAAENGVPDGIFCHNDELAIGCFRALCELGVRVPEDTAIVGCDGITDTEFHARQISTLAAPVDEMCQMAWTFLQNRMQNPDHPLQQTTFIPPLLIRESSRR